MIAPLTSTPIVPAIYPVKTEEAASIASPCTWRRIVISPDWIPLLTCPSAGPAQRPFFLLCTLPHASDNVSVKGLVHPVRAYRVVGIYDELERDGRIIREERDGFRLLVDLTKGDQARTIAAVENVLARLKG